MHSGRFGSAINWPANSTQLAARAKRRSDRFIVVSMGVFIFWDVSGAAVSRWAAGFGAGTHKRWESEERVGRASLKQYGQHGAVPRLLFLLAKTLHGVFRELHFTARCKLRSEERQSKPSVGRL
jgi:hypothetical protein